MKRKFLAKAITLGLMLAVPLGAQAADKELTIDSSNANQYKSGTISAYDISQPNEKQEGNITLNINKDGAMDSFNIGNNKIITIQTTADNATSTINGSVTVTSQNITANRVMGVLANSDNSTVTVNGDVKLDIKDSTLSAGGIRAVQAQNNAKEVNVNGNVNVTANNLNGNVEGVLTFGNTKATISKNVTVIATNKAIKTEGVYTDGSSQANIGGDVTVTATNTIGNVYGVNTQNSSQANIGGNLTVTATNTSGNIYGITTQSSSQANIGGNVTVTATNTKSYVSGIEYGYNITVGGDINVKSDNATYSVYGIRDAHQTTVDGNINVEATNTNSSVIGVVTGIDKDITLGGNINVNITNIKTANVFVAFDISQGSSNQIGTAAKPANINLNIIGTGNSDFKKAEIKTVRNSGNLTHYGNANLYLENIGAITTSKYSISGYDTQIGETNLVGDVNVTYVATDKRVNNLLNKNIFGVSVWGTLNHTGNVNVYLAGNAEKMGLDNNTVYGSAVHPKYTYNRTGLRTLYFGNDKVQFDSNDDKPFKGSFANFDIVKVSKNSSLVLNNQQNKNFTGDRYLLDIWDGNITNLPADSNKLNGITSKGGTLSLGNDNTLIVEEGASAKIDTVTSNAGNIVANGADKITIGKFGGNKATITTDTVKDSLIDISDNSNAGITVIGNSKASDMLTGNNLVEDLQKVADTAMIRDGEKRKDLLVEQGTILGSMQGKTDENGKVIAESVTQAVNTDNEAISNMAAISLMTWIQENNDMNKRLGELRDSKGEHGAWARMARGESKYGAQNVKYQYNYYQVGYDEKLSVNPNWTVGVALTRTEGSSTFNNGSAENKHTGVAVYGSYLKDDGSFIDLIAKYARMKNEFTVSGGAGNGDYETNGYSLSAEYGKRFTKDNGFWIEPQVELTYGYVGAASYLSSNGANVRQDGMDSLVGRIGFSLGRDIKAGNVYARASYLYDFDGETDVSFSKGTQRSSFKQDLGGWWEVGVGTNLNLSEATHLYFDVEKTYGGNVATPWQWNAGVRWSF